MEIAKDMAWPSCFEMFFAFASIPRRMRSGHFLIPSLMPFMLSDLARGSGGTEAFFDIPALSVLDSPSGQYEDFMWVLGT